MRNLRKAQKIWARLTRIIGQKGANLTVSGMFFKAVVQAVPLFGSETWVTNPHIGQAMGSSQHGVARGIMGRKTKIRE